MGDQLTHLSIRIKEARMREGISQKTLAQRIDDPPEFFYPTNPGDVVKRLDNIDRKIEHLDKNISSLRRLIERWDEGQE